MKISREVRRSIESTLIPAIAEYGFHRMNLSPDDAGSGEISRSFPYGRMRRRSGDDFHQIEIQFDKRKSGLFRLNFGIYPAKGVEHAAGFVSADDVWVHYLKEYFELCGNKLFRTWFDLDAGAAAVVEKVVSLLPGVMKVLESGSASPFDLHVRRVG